MKILFLEPYFGGSHEAFLTGWQPNSRHEWTLLTAPAHNWKWRMRHSAITFAQETRKLIAAGQSWDAIFCSDMLNLAEFIGLAPASLKKLPTVVYFHENQLTYPVRNDDPRDVHFGLTNMTTALAADAVWFNSTFHKDSFLTALADLLKKFPPPNFSSAINEIENKSEIQPPGIDEYPPRQKRQPGPLRILWAARWEHDKNPEAFFAALELLQTRGVDFRISVIGQQFRDVPEIFNKAKLKFQDKIDRWGYQPSRAEYVSALAEADVAVSTADHEFFGLSMVETATAGAFPLVPNRLAYPEIFGLAECSDNSSDQFENPFIYDGTVQGLADRLATLADSLTAGDLCGDFSDIVKSMVKKFAWPIRAAELDSALEKSASIL